MEIFVHYPKTEEGIQELKRRVAKIHAEAVNSTIEKLSCPREQKEALVDAVIQEKNSVWHKT